MGNPLIDQGTLNRLRGSIVWKNLPKLNVTAPFLGQEGLSLTLEGESTTIIPTMTGVVTSPEPFHLVTVMAHLLRTQNLSDLYKQQQEKTTLLGNCTIRPDSKALSPYLLYNCAIVTVGELNFNGTNPGYGVSFKGYWNINADLWNSV
jgi:hypothetical protein